MARNKSITDEALLREVEAYRVEHPDSSITIPLLGTYLRGKGYKVEDYTLRRNGRLRKYLEQLQSASDEQVVSDLVAYHTLNTNEFVLVNNTPDKLCKALIQRDQYYAGIAAKAVAAIKSRQKADAELAEAQSRIAELEAERAAMREKDYERQIKERDAVIKRLKQILDDYIYPDAANAILIREGVLKPVSPPIIPSELMAGKTISADTDIRESQFAAVNDLFSVFEED